MAFTRRHPHRLNPARARSLRSSSSSMMLGEPSISVLGPDPDRVHILNGNAFQQDALVSFAGWQYAAFYSALDPSSRPTSHHDFSVFAVKPVFVHLSRRKLPDGPWQTFAFDDYDQTTDDGHNTVQIGICAGDGTIHLSYDHHCDVLRYRHSVSNLASTPESFDWTSSHFTSTTRTLPGLASDDADIKSLLSYITYPRFGSLGTTKLWFSFRTGKAGLGDDHLAIYDPSRGGYSKPVTHLKGIDSNPYINGLDYRAGTLYTTWVYRGFVEYPGWDDPLDTKHKAQAGPNSGENNHDLCFAYSPNDGTTWRNSDGEIIADTTSERSPSVRPDSTGVRVFEIPKGSGLANQESQAIDHAGGVHVLNRDNLPHEDENVNAREKGSIRWKHYYRNPDTKQWTQTVLPFVETCYGGKRGQVAVSKDGDVYFILNETILAPSATAQSGTSPDSRLTILKCTRASKYDEYEIVWRAESTNGNGSGSAWSRASAVHVTDKSEEVTARFPPTEALVDRARLDYDNVLSIFTRASISGTQAVDEQIKVVVMDFHL